MEIIFSPLDNGTESMYITPIMKTQVHPQILVIQKISSVLIHGRDVETMLEKVLEIIDSEMGMRRDNIFVLMKFGFMASHLK